MNRMLIIFVVVTVFGLASGLGPNMPAPDLAKRNGKGCTCNDGTTTGIFWAGSCPGGWSYCKTMWYWVVPGECCTQK
uniref:Sea anemone sodium channel inhibitor type I n=1 Tax=Calliactis polypus TaxID=656064 RepID=NATX_CALPY